MIERRCEREREEGARVDLMMEKSFTVVPVKFTGDISRVHERSINDLINKCQSICYINYTIYLPPVESNCERKKKAAMFHAVHGRRLVVHTCKRHERSIKKLVAIVKERRPMQLTRNHWEKRRVKRRLTKREKQENLPPERLMKKLVSLDIIVLIIRVKVMNHLPTLEVDSVRVFFLSSLFYSMLFHLI